MIYKARDLMSDTYAYLPSSHSLLWPFRVDASHLLLRENVAFSYSTIYGKVRALSSSPGISWPNFNKNLLLSTLKMQVIAKF